MTVEIRFHVQLQDPVGYACRLIRKALKQGVQLGVWAPKSVLRQLDQQLWTFDDQAFLPHVILEDGTDPVLRDRSPVWLGDQLEPLAARPVLVNLGQEPVLQPERFAKLAELVGTDDWAMHQARQRFVAYRQAGLSPQRHEAAG